LATGSGDDTIRLWDLRALKSVYNIAAHRSNVADVRWFRGDDISRLKPLAREAKMEGVEEVGHDEGTSFPKPAEHERLDDELYRSGLYLASAGYDGFVKIWSADDWQLLHTLPTDGGKVMSVDFSSDKTLLVSGTYNRNFQLFAPEHVAPVA
jgi:U4/U6 small nuclear ribonucleoprotein PRP4